MASENAKEQNIICQNIYLRRSGYHSMAHVVEHYHSRSS